METIKLLRLTVFGFCILVGTAQAHIHWMSVPKPYDILKIRSQLDCFERCNDIAVSLFCSTKTKGCRVCDANMCNEGHKRVDVLQTWQEYQDGMAALYGAAPDSRFGEISQLFNVQDDAAQYAQFVPKCRFSLQEISIAAQRHLSSHWLLGLYLPVYHTELCLKQWQARALDTGLYEEALFRQKVEWGDGNHFGNKSWCPRGIGNIALCDKVSRWGCGDLAALCWWHGCFVQGRPWLRSTRVVMRGGMIFPTARKTDMNQLFSPTLGYNGGLGIEAGGNLELNIGCWALAGLDAEVVYLFGHNKIERIRTDVAQTDLLFFQKSCVFRDPGLVQQFTLYAGAHDRTLHFEGIVGYQYRKQNDDTIYPDSSRLDSVVASNAESVQEWTTHTLIVSGTWRRGPMDFSLAYQYTFNGKRSIGVDGLSATVGYAF